MNLTEKLGVESSMNIADFKPGDVIRVMVKVKEEDRERLQAFEGTVISKRGSGLDGSFTVRRISYGVGVERTFPFHSPVIDRVKVVKKGDVRRAKLYYLRGKVGKDAKLREETAEPVPGPEKQEPEKPKEE